MAEDLTTNRKIQTVSQLMMSLEDEIAAIKNGDLKENQGRLVLKARGLQIQGVQLYLQAARMESKLRPQLVERMGKVIDLIPAPQIAPSNGEQSAEAKAEADKTKEGT